MRKLTSSQLTEIATSYGLEPVIFIELVWSTNSTTRFADKNFPDQQVEGRILELGNLNDVLRVDSSGSSGTISVLLSDTDSLLKGIIDSRDIHKLPVNVYQWFAGSSIDPFIILEGQIVSPIVWSEAERTLSFDIATKVEDIEVGFSPEDGQFQNLNLDLIGQAWPICFGTVQMVPAVKLVELPTCILLTDFGIPDWGINEQIHRLQYQYGNLKVDYTPSFVGPDATLDQLNQTLLSDSLRLQQALDQVQKEKNDITQEITSLQGTMSDQTRYFKLKQLQVTMDNYFPDGTFIVKLNDTLFRAQISRRTNQLGIMDLTTLTVMPPPLTPLIIDPVTGEINDGKTAATSYGFQYFNVGTTVTIVSEYPIPHVVSCIPGEVQGVYAYRSFGGVKKLSPVPPAYYTIAQGKLPTSIVGEDLPSPNTTVPFPSFLPFNPKILGEYGTSNPLLGGVTPGGTSGLTGSTPQPDVTPSSDIYAGLSNRWFNPLYVILKRPLSITSWLIARQQTYINQLIEQYANVYTPQPSHIQNTEEWDDDIYVVVKSSVGPNVVDIMEWVISNFTIFTFDGDSFDSVKSKVSRYPTHFALLEKKNVLQFLNELATQSRCQIWLAENVFYIRYLSEEPDSVDDITEADIEAGSLVLSCTDTESMVTKYTASYRVNYLPRTKENLVILRNNVGKYGIQEEAVSYYSNNNHYAVKKSATFWLIRKSNTWRKLQFKTFLHKLNLQTLDCVQLTIPTIFEGTVKGIIESAVYDSADNTIAMDVWLPIRFGETKPYKFGWPSSVSETDVFPTVLDIQEGGGTMGLIAYKPAKLPFINVTGTTVSEIGYMEEAGGKFLSDHEGYTDRYIDSSTYPDTGGTLYPSDSGDPTINSHYVQPYSVPMGKTPPTFDYTLADYKPKDVTVPTAGPQSSGYPGKVTGGPDDKGFYTVDSYPHGLDEKAVTVKVKQLQINKDDNIDPNTWGIVALVQDSKGKSLYYMQIPVWQ